MPRFGHLASLVWVWAYLILGCLRDAVLPDFLDFLLAEGTDDELSAFFTEPPVMGDNAVDTPQGLRICVRVFCLI